MVAEVVHNQRVRGRPTSLPAKRPSGSSPWTSARGVWAEEAQQRGCSAPWPGLGQE